MGESDHLKRLVGKDKEMKTEELTALGLSEDQIKGVFALNGTDIEKLKQDIEKHKQDVIKAKEELEGVKTQLGEANATIKGFEELDVEGIKKAADEWKTKYEQDTEALKNQMATKDYEFAVDKFLGGIEFSSDLAKKAVFSEFKEKAFKLEDGKFLGADDYIKALQESNPGAFVKQDKTDPEPPGVILSSGGVHGSGIKTIDHNAISDDQYFEMVFAKK